MYADHILLSDSDSKTSECCNFMQRNLTYIRFAVFAMIPFKKHIRLSQLHFQPIILHVFLSAFGCLAQISTRTVLTVSRSISLASWIRTALGERQMNKLFSPFYAPSVNPINGLMVYRIASLREF